MGSYLINLGACCAAVGVLVISVAALANPVFDSGINPDLQSHFSKDKESWWREIPVEALPIPSGAYGVRNGESFEAAKKQLSRLTTGRSSLGELPIVEVSHPKKGSVEVVLSKEKADCGVITDELRLERGSIVDIDDDSVAELCVFLGRAERSDTCGYGTGSFLGYGDWYVLGKRTVKGKVNLLEVREADCLGM